MSDYKKDFEKSIEFIEWQNTMLRQQADRIAHLEMLVANRNEIIDKLNLTPQTKPLSDEEIDDLWKIYTKEPSYYFGFAIVTGKQIGRAHV